MSSLPSPRLVPLVLTLGILGLLAALFLWIVGDSPSPSGAAVEAETTTPPPVLATSPSPPALVNSLIEEEEAALPVEGEERIALATSEERWLRVVDAKSGNGLAGIELQLAGVDYWNIDVEPWIRHSVTTGAGGRVSVTGLITRAEAVHAYERSDLCYTLRPSPFDPRRLGARPEEAFVLTRAKRKGTAFLGRLVDETNGEAVGEHCLRVVAWFPASEVDEEDHSSEEFERDVVWIVTAPDGTFATPRPYLAGELSLLDQFETPVDAAHRPGASYVDVEIELGPIMLLDFDPPRGRQWSDFLAILEGYPGEALREMGVVEIASPFTEERGEWGWDGMPVQGEETPWVRFDAGVLHRYSPGNLTLLSRDGLYFGSARFESLIAHREDPLRVELGACASLRGRVTWPEAQMPDAVEFRLDRIDVDGDPDGFELWSTYPEHEGASELPFRFRGLPAGRWRLVAWADRCDRVERDVELRAGIVTQVDLVLTPVVELFELRGSLRTASGRRLDGEEGRARLVGELRLQGRGDLDYVVRLSALMWDEEGRAEFLFDELPRGEYELFPDWSRGAFSLSPSRLRVPTGDVDVLVLDHVAVERFEVVIEGSSPGLDPWIRLSWRGAGGLESTLGGRCHRRDAGTDAPPDPFRIFLGPVPAGGTIHARVTAPGFRPRALETDDFTPPDFDGRRSAAVTLEPGWGVRIDVRDEHGSPLAGIVLRLDDTILPPTDPRGQVGFDAAEKPKVLRVESSGWTLAERVPGPATGGRVEPGTGEFAAEHGLLEVTLRRD